MSKIVWHYTNGEKFLLIMESSFLATEMSTTKAVMDLMPESAGCVWFSTNQEWDPTANKGVINEKGEIKSLSMLQTGCRCKGLYRFGVRATPPIYHWDYLKNEIGLNIYKHLKESGIKQGANPNQWYASLEPIPLEKVERIERYVLETGEWENITDHFFEEETLDEDNETKWGCIVDILQAEQKSLEKIPDTATPEILRETEKVLLERVKQCMEAMRILGTDTEAFPNVKLEIMALARAWKQIANKIRKKLRKIN